VSMASDLGARLQPESNLHKIKLNSLESVEGDAAEGGAAVNRDGLAGDV
jgi:hypothetical protein